MPTIIKVGGGYKNLKGTATTADVLSNKTFSTNGKELVTGSMTNNGSVTQSLNCGSSYTIPKGYHDGSGKVTANSLSSQTSGTATASDILSGKTAWVGGSKITGSMTDRGAISQTLSANGTYTIPQGYHNGSGKVTQSLTTKGATTYTPTTSNQTIPSGTYLTGVQTITGDANLIASNIKSGVSIFGVVGSMVENATKVATGTFSTDTNTSGQRDIYYKTVDVGFQPSGVAIISLNNWNLSSTMDDNPLAMYILPSSTKVQVWRLDSGNKVTLDEVTEDFNTSIYSPYYVMKRTSTGFSVKLGDESVGNVGETYGKGSYWYIAWKV